MDTELPSLSLYLLFVLLNVLQAMQVLDYVHWQCFFFFFQDPGSSYTAEKAVQGRSESAVGHDTEDNGLCPAFNMLMAVHHQNTIILV